MGFFTSSASSKEPKHPQRKAGEEEEEEAPFATVSDQDDDTDEEETTTTSYFEPDVYGQIHPVETQDLLQRALKDFEAELAAVPADVSASAYLAERRCPDIANDQFKLVFLRTEVFRINDAVKRYTYYWKKRIELFGEERAFKPIHISNMNEVELQIIRTEYVYIVPATQLLDPTHPAAIAASTKEKEFVETAINKENEVNKSKKKSKKNAECDFVETRSIFYVNYGVWDKHLMCNKDWVRVMWYYFHVLIDDINTQRKGIIFIGNPQGFKLRQFPTTDFLSTALSFVQDCVPVRLSAFHVIYPPTVVKLVFPIMSMLMKERLRKRILVHTDMNFKNTFHRLVTKYGFTKERLPEHMGGEFVTDYEQYIQDQLTAGK